jgi:hypothetical protein
MFGVKFKKSRNLKRFGGMVMVTTKKKIQGKLSDRGTVCMFLEYPRNHSDNVYRLFNVIKLRDFVWLEKDYES